MRRLLLILGVLLAATPATATIVKALSLEQMAQAADVVVLGQVAVRTSSWNAFAARWRADSVRLRVVSRSPRARLTIEC